MVTGGRASKRRWPPTTLPGGVGPLELGKAARQNMERREADSSSAWCRALALVRSSRTPSLPGTWGQGRRPWTSPALQDHFYFQHRAQAYPVSEAQTPSCLHL